MLAARLELALADAETTEARVVELRKALTDAEVRLGRPGRDARALHWDVLVQVRARGLEPPLRWPVTGRASR